MNLGCYSSFCLLLADLNRGSAEHFDADLGSSCLVLFPPCATSTRLSCWPVDTLPKVQSSRTIDRIDYGPTRRFKVCDNLYDTVLHIRYFRIPFHIADLPRSLQTATIDPTLHPLHLPPTLHPKSVTGLKSRSCCPFGCAPASGGPYCTREVCPTPDPPLEITWPTRGPGLPGHALR